MLSPPWRGKDPKEDPLLKIHLRVGPAANLHVHTEKEKRKNPVPLFLSLSDLPTSHLTAGFFFPPSICLPCRSPHGCKPPPPACKPHYKRKTEAGKRCPWDRGRHEEGTEWDALGRTDGLFPLKQRNTYSLSSTLSNYSIKDT